MIAQTPLLLHLTSSFLISNLRLFIEPETPLDERSIQTPLIFISPNRNISLSLQGSTIFADGLPLLSNIKSNEVKNNSVITLTAKCQHGFAFRLNVGDLERTIASPSFCAHHKMNRECFKNNVFLIAKLKKAV
jgi:hypothetical protein